MSPMGGMSGDAWEDVGQPGLRVYFTHLGGDDQAMHGRGALSAAVKSAERHDFLPRAMPLSPLSAALLERHTRPSSRNRVKLVHRFRMQLNALARSFPRES
jgi:hypothetical protein